MFKAICLKSRQTFTILVVLSMFLVGFPIQSSAASITITDLKLEVEGVEVLVSWRTSQNTSGCVQFGTSKNYELQRCAITTPSTNHDILLGNLLDETFYHFRVTSTGTSGDIVSFDGTFKTGERSDTTKPEIDNLNLAYVGTTNIYITWETNEKTNGKVEYGFGSGDLSKRKTSRKDTVHDVHLTGLEPGALYFYRVVAEDEDKNQTVSSIQSFRTSVNPRVDENPLRIVEVRPVSPNDSQIGETTVRVTWRNTRPADGVVAYGTNPERLGKKIRVEENRTFQEAVLEKLRPGTTYYFRVEQTDILRNKAEAPSRDGTYSFTTKSRRTVLGTSTTVTTSTGKFTRTPQASVLTSLTGRAPQVLGAFTTIYTPAKALVKTIHSPKIYAVINNQLHWIKSANLFNVYGYNFADVRVVSQMEINNTPQIHLVKTPDNPAVYFINQDGLKINIPNAKVFNSYKSNKWKDIITIAKQDLDSFPNVRLVKSNDSGTVYLLENKAKRPFASKEVLERFGFRLNEVVTLNQIHLQTILEGPVIK